MAYFVSTVLLERLGGFVTFTDAEWEQLNDRYGGRVTFSTARTKDGRWEVRLVKAKPRGVERMS